MSIKSAVGDFRNGLSFLFRKPDATKGDPQLARLSRTVTAQIPVYGKNVVRNQVIKAIEGDLKRTTRKGPEATEKLIHNAFSTPEYVTLLYKLGLEESHIRVMAMEAKRKYGKN
jgi:hypothetical protein